MFMYISIVQCCILFVFEFSMTFCNFQQHVTRKETYATEILQIIRLRGKLNVSVTNIT